MTMSLTGNASQATQVEQARAAAEVAAAIRVAQDCPRDIDLALRELERSCQRKAFAMRAFYRYGRGGQQLTGPTIQFAQEAARCWQNMQSGMVELSRTGDRSEMMAWAWDVQFNTRRVSTFVSPHRGYTDGADSTRELVAMRDIYENNASAAARREREMILSILPTWYVEQGKDWARAALAGGEDGKPIETRRAEVVKSFEQIGVRREQLVGKIGAPVDAWLDVDLATLVVIGKSIKAGETSAEHEFGERARPEPGTGAAGRVTASEITGGRPPAPGPAGAGPAPAPAPAADSEVADEPPPAPDPAEVRRRERRLFALLRDAGLSGKNDRDRRLALLAFVLDRPAAALSSSTQLTHDDRWEVITELEGWAANGSLRDTAAAVLDRPAHEQPDAEPAEPGPPGVPGRAEQMEARDGRDSSHINGLPRGVTDGAAVRPRGADA